MERYPGQKTKFFAVFNGVVSGPFEGLEALCAFPVEPDTPVWYKGLGDWQPAIMAPLTRQIFDPRSPYNLALRNPSPDIDEPQTTEETGEVANAADTEPHSDETDTTDEPSDEQDADVRNTETLKRQPPVLPVQPPQLWATPIDDSREEVREEAGETDAFQPAPEPRVVAVRQPNSYLVWSIISTIVCNPLAGIVAIVYSWKVRSYFRRGELERAQRCSETAQWWIAISFTLGIIGVVAQMFMGGLL